MSSNNKKTIQQQLEEARAYIHKLVNSPPLNYYTPKIVFFWIRYGFHVRLTVLLILILSLTIFGVNFGLNLSKSQRMPIVTVPALPTLAPPTLSPASSKIRDLQKDIQVFSTLLPDPAPPSIDEGISLRKELKN